MMYSLMAESGGRPINVDATSAEMAYRKEGCWFRPSTVVMVWDNCGTMQKFSRKIDRHGNLIEVIKEG